MGKASQAHKRRWSTPNRKTLKDATPVTPRYAAPSTPQDVAKRVLAFLLSFFMATSSFSTQSLVYAQELITPQEDVQQDAAPAEQQSATDAQAAEQEQVEDQQAPPAGDNTATADVPAAQSGSANAADAGSAADVSSATGATDADGANAAGVANADGANATGATDADGRDGAEANAELGANAAQADAEKSVAKDADGKEAKTEDETSNTAMPAFQASVSLEKDGIIVYADAEEGTFPEGATLDVRRVDLTKAQAKTVDEATPEDQNVAKRYSFDVRVLDAQGNELQPAEGKTVDVRFALAEAGTNSLNAQVYHHGGARGNDLEALPTTEATFEGTDVVETEASAFSTYTVVFTYGNLSYTLEQGTETTAAAIASGLGLQGTVKNAVVMDPSSGDAAVEVASSGADFVVTPKAAGTATLTLTLEAGDDPVSYDITATVTEASDPNAPTPIAEIGEWNVPSALYDPSSTPIGTRYGQFRSPSTIMREGTTEFEAINTENGDSITYKVTAADAQDPEAPADSSVVAISPINSVINSIEYRQPGTAKVWITVTTADGATKSEAKLVSYTAAPVTAIALGESGARPACYATLKEAFEAMRYKSSARILVHEDITVTADDQVTVEMNSGSSYLELNLQGHTISLNQEFESPWYLFNVQCGTLVVSSLNHPGAKIDVQGTNARAFSVKSGNATLDLNSDDVTVSSGSGNTVMLEASAKLRSSGNISSERGYAVATDATNSSYCDIKVYGGTISSTSDTAIYYPNKGTVYVYGGTISGGKSGIEMRNGNLFVENTPETPPTIKSTSTAQPSSSSSPNGATTTGAAIAIARTPIPLGGMIVNVKTGTLEGPAAVYESSPEGNNEAQSTTVSLNGGTFLTTLEGGSAVYTENGYVHINGGLYSDATESTTAALSSGLTLRQLTQGTNAGLYSTNTCTVTYLLEDGADPYQVDTIEKNTKAVAPTPSTAPDGYTFREWQLNGARYDFDQAVSEDLTLVAAWDEEEDPGVYVASITRDGKRINYETLGEAVTMAQPNETIVILQNVESGHGITIAKSLTINLNGHKISNTNGISWATVTNDATLTINGTKAGSEVYGRVNAGTEDSPSGNIVINGGTYTCAGQQTVLDVHKDCRNSNVTIKDATITSPDDNGVQFRGAGTFLIQDSTISGFTAVYQKAGNLSITNSTLASTATSHTDFENGSGAFSTGDALVVDTCAYAEGAPTTTLGENVALTVAIDANKQVGYYEYNTEAEGFGRATIKATSNDFTLPEGYAWAQQSDNTYLVAHLWTVSFDANGGEGTFDDQSVVDGEKATMPSSSPTTEGKRFKEWQLNGTPYDFNDPVTANIRLTAAWRTEIDLPTPITSLYDGTTKHGVATENVNYEVVEEEGFTNEATEAGTYQAKIQPKDGYVWDDGTLEPKTVSWTIEQTGDVEVPTPNGPFTYDGAEHVGVTATADDGVILEGDVRATDVGTYTVTARHLEGRYWKSGTEVEPDGSVKIEWTIQKADLTIRPDAAAKAYRENDPALIYTTEGAAVPTSLAVELGREEGENVGTYVISVKAIGGEDVNNYEIKRETATFTITPRDLSTIEIPSVPSQTYTGSPIEPVEVTDGDATFVEGEDYTITYQNNIDVGVAKATIKGINNCTGKQFVYFAINKKGSDGYELQINPETYNYTGEAITPGSVTLVNTKGTDETSDDDVIPASSYDLVFMNNKEPGTATVIATLKGNYEGVVTGTFQIVGGKEVAVPQAIAGLVYDGTEQMGVLEGEGFTLEGNTGTNAGDYVATATLAKDYVWSDGTSSPKSIAWSIAKKHATAKVDDVTKVYGDPDPEFTVTFTGLVGDDTISYTASRLDEGDRVARYDITADITPNPNYDLAEATPGTLTIVARDISSAVIAPIENQPYTGEEIKPVPRVTLGEGELPPSAYETIYENNTDVGLATVTLYGYGDGNYTGTVSAQFAINRKGSTDVAMAVNPATYTYTGEAVVPTEVTVYDKSVEKTKPHPDYFQPEGSDKYYKIISADSYDLAFYNNVNAGTATAVATLKGNYEGATTTTYAITKADVERPTVTESFTYDGTEKTAVEAPAADATYRIGGTSKATDTGSYTVTAALKDTNNYQWAATDDDADDATSGDLAYTWTIAPKTDGLSVDDIDDQTYTGSPIEPAVIVKDGDKALAEGTDYTVAYASNTEVGTSTATVTGKGNYAGANVSKDFNIVAKPLKKIAAPTAATDLVYNAKEQTGVEEGEGYTLSGVAKATDAGDYAAIATLAEGYAWADAEAGHEFDNLTIGWIIAKKPIDVPRAVEGLVYKGKDQYQTGVPAGEGYTVTGNVEWEWGTWTAYVTPDANHRFEDDEAVKGVKWDIGQAPVTIKADDKTKVYGEEDPVLTFTETGTFDGDFIKATLGRAEGDGVGSYDINVTSISQQSRYNATGEKGTLTILPKDVSALDVPAIPNQTYTGSAITPVVVRDGEGEGARTLVEGTDYDVAYDNNVEVGVAKATITGRGNYAGKETVYFAISKKGNASYALEVTPKVHSYTGRPVEPSGEAVVVRDTKGTAETGDDEVIGAENYDLTYSNNVEPGIATVIATLKGNYEGAVTGTFNIIAQEVELEILPAAIPDQAWTGEPVEPQVTVKAYVGTGSDRHEVENFKNYELAYANNVEPGKATVTATATSPYSGSASKSFNIVRADVEVEAPTAATGLVYNGTEKTGVLEAENAEGYTLSGTKKATDAGTYTATATLDEGYAWADGVTPESDGTVKVEWTIAKRPAAIKVGSWTIQYSKVVDFSAFEVDVEGEVGGERLAYELETEYRAGDPVTDEGYPVTVAFDTDADPNKNYDIATTPGTLHLYKLEVEPPTAATGLVYNGSEQDGVVTGSGWYYYELSGTTKATDAGEYTATAKLPNGRDYRWADGTGAEDRDINWSIAKADISTAYIAPIDSQTYDSNAKEPELGVTLGETQLKAYDEQSKEGDYKATYANNVDAGIATATIEGTGNYTGKASAQFAINAADATASQLKIQSIADQAYTGSEITPEVTIKDTDGKTVNPKYYDLTFMNNKKVGTATVIATMKGNYDGAVTTTFQIVEDATDKAALKDAIDEASSEKSEQDPTGTQVPVSEDGSDLPAGAEYVTPEDQKTLDDAIAAAQKVYDDPNQTSAQIAAAKKALEDAIKDYNDVKKTAAAKEAEVPTAVEGLVYDGAEKAGVTYDNAVPFTVTGDATGTDAGDYGATFTLPAGYVWKGAEGEAATAPKTVSWSIAKAKVDVPTAIEGLVYNGKEQEGVKPLLGAPYSLSGDVAKTDAGDYAVTATLNDVNNYAWKGVQGEQATAPKTIAWSIAKAKVDVPAAATGLVYNGKAQTGVEAGSDYEVQDGIASEAKSYTATASLKDPKNTEWNLPAATSVDQKIAWSIEPLSMAGAFIEPIGPQTYDGTEKTPEVTVTIGDATLEKGKDYEVLYANNKDIGVATAVVEGKGNYVGKTSTQFAIVNNAASDASIEPIADVTYTGEAIVPDVVVKDGKGNTLVAGKDYDLAPISGNVNVGTVLVSATLKGNYSGNVAGSFRIVPAKITSAAGAAKTYNGKAHTTTWTVKAGSLAVPAAGFSVSAYKANTNAGTATATVKGKGNFTGSVTGKFKINPAKITAVATKASVAYTGKAVKPKLTVKAGSATVAASGYTATWSNNTKVGTATVSVTGKGNYTGSAKTTFKIVAPTVQYKVHRQTYGWETEWKRNGDQSGTVGESKRLEGIYVMLGKDFPVSGGIRYKTHVQRNGWEPDWRYSGQLSGTLGESKRLEAIRIELTGDMAKAYDVYYRVHAQQLGWMGWAKNGADAGTAGYSYRLEAIQIVLVPKGGAAPAKTLKGATQKVAQAFVQK